MRLRSLTGALAGVLRMGIACVLALTLGKAGVHAASARPPADVAEEIRSVLVAAQIEPDREAAIAQVQQAREVYARDLAPVVAGHASSSHALITQRFDDAIEALRNGEMNRYAQARAGIWTALLGAGYRIVIDAVNEGDVETAKRWLPLREFRRSTRFARPGAEATLALDDLERGAINSEVALQAVNADLLDTYQARMTSALSDIARVRERGFFARQAELAALASGYFEILAAAYLERSGETRLAEARAAFEALNRAALQGREIASAMRYVQAALQGFRAAPLSPAEQTRRAGQMMRYLKLVPIEYGRGIRNGEVAVDLEIREAITFHEGASAAFSDLRDM